MKRLAAAALLLALPAAPALGQRLGQAQGSDVPIWRVAIALLFCLALAAGAAFILRRRMGGGGGGLRGLGGLRGWAGLRRERRLRLIESVRIGPQAYLSIVACDGAELLIASGPQGTQVIKPELTPPPGDPE